MWRLGSTCVENGDVEMLALFGDLCCVGFISTIGVEEWSLPGCYIVWLL
jgi:hypothetical protein